MNNLNGLIKKLRDIMRMDPGISGDAQRIEQISWIFFLKIYDSKEEDWEFSDENYKSIIPEKYRWRNWAKPDENDKSDTGDKLLNLVNNELFPELKKLPVDANTPIKKSIVRTVFEETNQYMKDGVQLRKIINEIDAIDFNSNEDSQAFGEIYEIFLKELQSAGSAGEFYTPRAVTDFMAEKINPKIGEVCADLACGTGGFLTSWLKVLEPKVNTSNDREEFESSVYGIEKKQFPYTLCITNMLLHDIDNPEIYHRNSLEKNILDITEDEQFDVIMMNPPYGGSENEGISKAFPKDLRSSETADLFMALIMFSLKVDGRAAVILPDGFLFGTDSTKLNMKTKLLKDFNLHTIIRMPGSVFAPYTSITTNILFFDRKGTTKETWFYRLDMPEGYKNFSKTKPMKREHFAPVDEWWDNRVEIQDDNGTWKSKKYSVSELLERDCNFDLCGFPTEEKVILSPEDTLSTYIQQREDLEKQLSIATQALKENLLYKKNVKLLNIGSITKKLSRINEQFPGDLRDALLQAAIQGKLTEQRAEDGTAEDLLKEIKKEKAKLIAEGKIKKEKALPPIKDDEIPFEIPESWRWVRFSDVFYKITDGTHSTPRYTSSGIPFLSVKDISSGKIDFTNAKCISIEEHSELYQRCNPEKWDLLITKVGTTGVPAIVDTDIKFSLFVSVALLKFFHASSSVYYLYYALKSPLVQEQARENTRGVGNKNWVLDAIKNTIIPLPPLAEQHRIVERLNELLPLCEAMKGQE